MAVFFFYGKKPAIHGRNGTEVLFAVCCDHSSKQYTDLNGGNLMRHIYFRFLLGIVWLAAAVVCAMNANITFAALYVLLGIVFLGSAYSLWKKEEGRDDRRKHNG